MKKSQIITLILLFVFVFSTTTGNQYYKISVQEHQYNPNATPDEIDKIAMQSSYKEAFIRSIGVTLTSGFIFFFYNNRKKEKQAEENDDAEESE